MAQSAFFHIFDEFVKIAAVDGSGEVFYDVRVSAHFVDFVLEDHSGELGFGHLRNVEALEAVESVSWLVLSQKYCCVFRFDDLVYE
jgi:hypothetical protein